MQVAKWGNSLAVRIPAELARSLGIAEGDDIQLRAAEDGAVEIAKDAQWVEALARIRELARPLPADYRFDREEANAR